MEVRGYGVMNAEATINCPDGYGSNGSRSQLASNDIAYWGATQRKGWQALGSRPTIRTYDSSWVVDVENDAIFKKDSTCIDVSCSCWFTLLELNISLLRCLINTMLPSRGKLAECEEDMPDRRVYIYTGSTSVSGFYHWFYDWLPRVLYLLESAENNRLEATLLIGRLDAKEYHLETLKILKSRFQGLKWESISERLKVRGTMLTSPLMGSPGNCSSVKWGYLRRFRDALSHYYGEGVGVSSRKTIESNILFLTRCKGSSGCFSSKTEAIVVEACKSRGVLLTCMGDHSFYEQVELARQATVVISLHGADLSLFPILMNPGGLIIEIMDKSWNNACYERSAAAAGVRYFCWFIENNAGKKRGAVELGSREIEKIIDKAFQMA